MPANLSPSFKLPQIMKADASQFWRGVQARDVPETPISPQITRLTLWHRSAVILGVALLSELRVFWPALRAHLRQEQSVRNRLVGEALARAAETLGPVFTKAAQAISYRTDLLPQSFLEPLARLQENVRSQRAFDRELAVCATLLRPPNNELSSVDELPIACGSIAAVFRATTRAGLSVAIKVVRPGVAEAINLDLACLRVLMLRAARMRFAAGIPVIEIFESIAGMVAGQCDMVREAQNLQAFAKSASQTRGISIPHRRENPTMSPNLLVMNYVDDGVSISSSDLDDWRFKSASLNLLRFLYRMIFIDGFVHCDLHPGNIRVRIDGSVCLLDAGLAARLTPEDRDGFRDFFVALARGDTDAMTSAIIKSATSVPADLAQIELRADVETLVRNYSGRNAGDFTVAEFVYRVFDLQRKHRLYGAPGFVSAIWALLMFEGVVRSRYPDLDFQSEARPYAIASLLPSNSRPRSINWTRA